MADVLAQVILLHGIKLFPQSEVLLGIVKVTAVGLQGVMRQANRRSAMFQELFARFSQSHEYLVAWLKAASFDAPKRCNRSISGFFSS